MVSVTVVGRLFGPRYAVGVRRWRNQRPGGSRRLIAGAAVPARGQADDHVSGRQQRGAGRGTAIRPVGKRDVVGPGLRRRFADSGSRRAVG